MYLLRYEGGWHEVSARHPESFTVLAPPGLQRICRIFGGARNHYGDPLFRLVLVSSRYTISGGRIVVVRNSNGNITETAAKEVFLPRYHVPPPYFGTYALEMWHPVEWWFRNGYAGNSAMDYDGAGNGLHQLEPIWDDGGFEAIWNGPGTPFVFTRDVSTDLVRWGIYIAQLFLSLKADELALAKLEQHIQQEADDRKATREAVRARRGTLPGPMVAVA